MNKKTKGLIQLITAVTISVLIIAMAVLIPASALYLIWNFIFAPAFSMAKMTFLRAIAITILVHCVKRLFKKEKK